MTVGLPEREADGGQAPLAGRFEAVRTMVHEHGISTCAISDALDGLSVPNAVLNPALHRIAGSGSAFFGAAVPVSWVPQRKRAQIADPLPSTWSAVRDFLLPEIGDGAGQVYVAGSGPLVRDAALAGGLSSTYLIEQLGFEGMVLGGAVRDCELLRQRRLPVVASNVVPTDTQGAFRVAEVGTVCVIDNVTVRAGDWVFSDGNGTVVIPAPLLDRTLSAAVAIEHAEREALRRIRSGEPLPQIIDEMGQI
ncbi:RraA family protein [Amycolatopsis sp. VS8301801F10]|uniref:RraA family protein n=1 Tax=Amycolatopsis sp. VS8301801F10 TaxID=2652442 RepID=UPI0038FC7565